ncbi:MAG: HEXXH motif-containing putative peptide modification protein [Pseudomonadota bacterium]
MPSINTVTVNGAHEWRQTYNYVVFAAIQQMASSETSLTDNISAKWSSLSFEEFCETADAFVWLGCRSILRERHPAVISFLNEVASEKIKRNPVYASDCRKQKRSAKNSTDAKEPEVRNLLTSLHSWGLLDDYIVPSKEEQREIRIQIEEALEFLRENSPEDYSDICSFIDFVVPIGSEIDRRTHHSFSLSRGPGIIFTSLARDRIRAAEALVHETGHNILNPAFDLDLIYAGDTGSNLYSPWRPDARPLSGLIHATFVFCKVLSLLNRIDFSEESEQDFWRSRIALIHRQLRIALVQINAHPLKELGKSLMDECNALLRSIKPSSANDHVELLISDHMDQWRRTHPNLELQELS